MILLAPETSGTIALDKGIFISTEMGQTISKELRAGKLTFNERFVPVHPPYDGLMKLDLGEHNHLKVEKEQWQNLNLPDQYNGENLNGKKMIIFPMHGLGDQLYLAVALRILSELYPDMEIVIVKSSIASAEQWYPHIYFDSFYRMTGPVVTCSEMQLYDYYLNAEHFAHIDAYQGSYPPDFYMVHFLNHRIPNSVSTVPGIGNYTPGESPNVITVKNAIEALKDSGKPLIFLSSVSTGRVRDFPLKTVIRLIELIQDRYAVLVSSFKRPDIHDTVEAMRLPHVKSTGDLITQVQDLIEIIRLSDIVITTDSGITHLAEALETPCGSVFNVVSPDERVGPYRFSESLNVEFSLDGVCRTPCYVHALKDGDLCPGMTHVNDISGAQVFYEYPPCLNGLTGEHLVQLLDAVEAKMNH